MIPRYQLLHNDFTTNAVDVAMSISNNLKYEYYLSPQIKLNIDGCEDLWINVSDFQIIVYQDMDFLNLM